LTLRALAIALYRQEAGQSPTLNFGRMPRGYRMSTGNNARLVRAGRRFRGGPTDADNESHRPGVPPPGPLEGSPLDLDWCGHQWSEWTRIEEASHEIPGTATGLYRILGSEGEIVYIGEGRIRSRLSAHLAKLSKPEGRQHGILADTAPLECSWVEGPWFKHQRLELETDLIGAFVLATRTAPSAQFVG
jgi:hypothetical protein